LPLHRALGSLHRERDSRADADLPLSYPYELTLSDVDVDVADLVDAASGPIDVGQANGQRPDSSREAPQTETGAPFYIVLQIGRGFDSVRCQS
jgi:hypothetical protein